MSLNAHSQKAPFLGTPVDGIAVQIWHFPAWEGAFFALAQASFYGFLLRYWKLG